LLPIGIPYLMGRTDLVIPLLIGVGAAVVTDATILYFSFDTEAFPAEAAWPPGIAAAQTILAAAEKGKKAMLLIYGIIGGVAGKMFGIPTDVFGVTWIGNFFALLAFGVGLVV
ncbi:MAG: OPT family oligopeptide transporter, partial [Bacillota bacterium]|nr:OPT family oligopeptide transporter [Bacillota bacterium]